MPHNIHYTLDKEPAFTVYRTHMTYGGIIPSSINTDDKKTLIHAIEAFGYLLKHGQSCTGKQFADLITEYSANDRSKHIADTVRVY